MKISINRLGRSFIFLILLGLQGGSLANIYNPTSIFPSSLNKIVPASFWLNNKAPYPTNPWFINLVLTKPDNSPSDPVTIFPYLIKTSPEGISLSYSSPFYYAEPTHPTIISAFYYQFENQLTLGATAPLKYGLASHHGMKIELQWKNEEQEIRVPIIQGSPYLTEYYNNAKPKLSSSFKWLSINKQTESGSLAPSQRFELVLALDNLHSQTWILYSEKPIKLDWVVGPKGHQLIAHEPYFGWLRLVLQKDTLRGLNNDSSILDNYSQTIPLDYKQQYTYDDKNLSYSFIWQTQNNQAPLILSLPHQRKKTPSDSSIKYIGIKGEMVGETRSSWNIELPKIPIEFLEKKNLSLQQANALRKSLVKDANTFLHQPFPDDGPYQAGKRYARAARLILIANRLQEYHLQRQMINFIKTELTKKMLDRKRWHFEYDKTWGGIIPTVDDYGARHYNDHHFHYGYWVYTFAVIAKFDLGWLKKPLASQSFSPMQWIEGLIDDYANKDPENIYFPLQRHQDDYVGHSWASGLTSFKDGQNQQSSSEAVNAYYALALYAKAIGDKSLFAWAEFLMARELVSSQWYWQIEKDSTIYSDKFKEHNQVVANLWDSKIDANAFFENCDKEYRCGLQYSFGIEMLPFTAISTSLFSKKWLLNAYPTIKKLINDQYGAIKPAWQWILIKGIASIMNKNEKEQYFKRAINSNPDDYDNGDSKTNTLYFLTDD